MKIGIFDPYLDDIGGGEKYMMSAAQCLSENHDVSVFWDQPSDITAIEKRFNLDLSRVERVKNIFSKQVSLLQRLLESKKYDVIIVLSDGSIPYLWCKKLLLHIQQPLKMSHHSLWRAYKLSRVSKVFYNSEFTKSYNTKAIFSPSTVIYPPVALHPQKMPRKNRIVHVGRFRVANIQVGDYKKQSVMVETFKEMVKSGLKDWEFVIATGVLEKDMDTFKKFEESAKGYPIHFVVNSTNADLWKIYSQAKIYWHASGFGEDLQQHPEFAEHFGMSTVEAMGAGVVPVVINAGGQKEIITDGENGYLWDSLDELQEKTQHVIAHPKEMLRLSKNAEKRAKDFSLESFCKKIQEVVA